MEKKIILGNSEHSLAVSVFGANDPRPGDAAYEVARSVGGKLAELGYGIVNGGYGGTMEASARGAKEVEGRTVGVTCSIWKSQPNPYIDEVVRTEGLQQRVDKLVELGRGGYVVLPGATGTLVELATVWERMCKGLLEQRPLVCVGSFWWPVVELMRSARPRCGELVQLAGGSEELALYFREGKSL